MTEISTKREQKKVRELANEYRRDGYSVITNPTVSDLPSQLRAVEADLLVSKGDEHILVEVKSRASLRNTSQLESIARQLMELPGWRLELVVTNPATSEAGQNDILPLAQTETYLSEAERLLSMNSGAAAILLGWAALEGCVRGWGASEQKMKTFVPASALIKQLFSRGHLNQDEFRLFDRIRTVRDGISHGQAVELPREATIRNFLDAAGKLVRKVRTHQV
jgi:hypothetical protein